MSRPPGGRPEITSCHATRRSPGQDDSVVTIEPTRRPLTNASVSNRFATPSENSAPHRAADRLRRAFRVATARRMTGRFEHFDACPGLPTGPGVRGRVGRAGSPPSTPTWSTPWEVTPSTPDHASTSGPTICPTGSTLQITRRDCRPGWAISPLTLNAVLAARCLSLRPPSVS